ncbi:hypothetical protein L9F63_005632, partial [Diploptera punctata]
RTPIQDQDHFDEEEKQLTTKISDQNYISLENTISNLLRCDKDKIPLESQSIYERVSCRIQQHKAAINRSRTLAKIDHGKIKNLQRSKQRRRYEENLGWATWSVVDAWIELNLGWVPKPVTRTYHSLIMTCGSIALCCEYAETLTREVHMLDQLDFISLQIEKPSSKQKYWNGLEDFSENTLDFEDYFEIANESSEEPHFPLYQIQTCMHTVGTNNRY